MNPAGTLPHIAVLGLGYVGLPLALQLVEVGAKVSALDVDKKKVRLLQQGGSYISHIPDSRIQSSMATGRFLPSTDISSVRDVGATLICVPTPLTRNRDPDLQFVLKTARAIAPHIARGSLVVLESTSFPGTTDTDLRIELERGSGMVAGTDFHLAFSPEREDPGNPESHLNKVPKVIGGLTPECLRRAEEIYCHIVPRTVAVSSCRVAEATKLMENIYRSVNIALVNELKVVYAAMGIDIWEVIEAAKTKPFGFQAFYPGPGLGGHCIPIDPFYLTWKAREFGMDTRFIELAGEVNTAMPDYVVKRVADALNDESKPVRSSRILLLGLAYKANVDDDRESPSYVIIEKLENQGALVEYHDPFVPVIELTRKHAKLAGRHSVPISSDYDLILICTAHDSFREFDFSNFDIPVVDTRNCVAVRNAKYYQA